MRHRPLALLALCLAARPAAAAPAIRDPDTKAWWAITSTLAADGMEGRDTGSPGHARAARVVAARLAAAGVSPAGEGGWMQSLPLREVRVEPHGTEVQIRAAPDAFLKLAFLQDFTVRPTAELPPTLDGAVSFRGYCGKREVGPDVRGRVLVCFAGRRRGVPGAAERLAAAQTAGAAALVNVDDPGFTEEPARWPEAYARSVGLRDAAPPAAPALPVLRLAAARFALLVGKSQTEATAILAEGSASRPLPAFDAPTRLMARFRISQREFSGENVLGLLPGTDPKLKHEVVVVSAHLDGYGFGTPVKGDALYNGAFDDAAYVATLIRLAERRHGRGFRRSVLFAAFTGEEKGLLGATWFTQHPTVAKADLAADLNLDQLRPLFPLKLLTVHALDQTTLGADVRATAAAMGVRVQVDPEPDRNLVQRADHWPFLKAGVPATGFVFGYVPGTEDERRYREWYRTRYHRPQDDLSQPWDPQAAADFNRFFYSLTARVADADARPRMIPAPASAAGVSAP